MALKIFSYKSGLCPKFGIVSTARATFQPVQQSMWTCLLIAMVSFFHVMITIIHIKIIAIYIEMVTILLVEMIITRV